MQGLHAAGLVHRDVKPLNIIFAEEERRFKLIDLGACADLRTGTNYTPDESILDPTYCPPEQVLPSLMQSVPKSGLPCSSLSVPGCPAVLHADRLAAPGQAAQAAGDGHVARALVALQARPLRQLLLRCVPSTTAGM